MRTVSPGFSARRMLVDYVNQMYLPAARGDSGTSDRRAKK